MNIFSKVKSVFDPSKQILKKQQLVIPQIRSFTNAYESKSTEELARIIEQFRQELAEINKKIGDQERDSIRMRRKSEKLSGAEVEMYKKLQAIMPEAYAIMGIVAKRKYGISHFDVQFLAGLVLASGQKLVEMKTGEGKTLTFQLPLFLYGLTGRGAHLVTVNDYLARRDGEYAGHLFAELGLSVGIITPQASYRFIKDENLLEFKGEQAVEDRKALTGVSLSQMRGTNLLECSKKEAYACNVVFGINNEFGFDYLRDNMAVSVDRRVQSELYFCIVDEADSILIDEARTPLIISSPAAESNSLYKTFAKLVPNLKAETDYVVEEKEKAVNLTDEGISKVEKMLKVSNVWEDYRLAHHLENALKAEVFYRKDKEYLIRNGEILIVDEFTGRVLAGRRYSEGLHQAIEAKEGVEIQQESRTLATITFQNFFRLYKILAGGSGTILTEQEEFFKIYNLEAVEIPTNKPMIRKDHADRVYKNKPAKFNAVVEEIALAHDSGQPILVGTTSISDSEEISRLLDKKKIKHEVLNAKFHEREAHIVSNAGLVGAVTVATNMAGRGTDIPLGEGASEKGGLYVIGTERHEARRIDNQLRGRSGRQGDQGQSRFFVALDDQIMKVQGGEIVQKIMSMTKLPDDLPLESRLISNSIERAQKRMEGMYFDSRKHVVEYDDVINQQREIFYARRFRYLQLASQLSDTDESKISPLINEFADVVESLSTSFSEMVEISGEGLDLNTIAKDIVSLGNDKAFMSVVNELKLYKDEVENSNQLILALETYLKGIKSKPAQVKEFLTKFFNHLVELRIKQLNNHSGLVKTIFIDMMDELWTLHLDFMQDLREGIGLRGVAQLDPLVEYKNEGFVAFKSFIGKLNRQAFQGLLQVSEVPQIIEVAEPAAPVDRETIRLATEIAHLKPEKVGRNDLCFCGSKKKYKKCGLLNSAEHMLNLKKSGKV